MPACRPSPPDGQLLCNVPKANDQHRPAQQSLAQRHAQPAVQDAEGRRAGSRLVGREDGQGWQSGSAWSSESCKHGLCLKLEHSRGRDAGLAGRRASCRGNRPRARAVPDAHPLACVQQ